MEVKHVSFSYGKNTILSDLSFSVKEGNITTVMGANGCGKSTLFSLMTKNQTPGKGKILLEGKNIANLRFIDFAKRVSIVHQYNSAADDITVERLVSYGRTPYQKMLGTRTKEDEELVERAMEVTGILPYRDREIAALSGGQRQRVWIAMALAQNTKIQFIDAPTTYLDIRYQLEILELVKKLNREYGITILMVLHEINQAITYSDEIIGVKDGSIVMQGKPQEVITAESMKELYGVSLKVVEVEGKKVVLTA